MNKKELLIWQKKRDDCANCINSSNGLWCTKDDIKCSFSNCKNTHPMTSDGKPKTNKNSNVFLGVDVFKKKGLTTKEILVLKYRNNGFSYAKIGKWMNFSKQRAYKIGVDARQKIGVDDKLGGLTKHKKKGLTFLNDKHKISLHNDSISIEAKINYDLVHGEIKKLLYTTYKFIKSEDTILKVFKKKIVIQFKKDIRSTTVNEAYSKANKRLSDYISSFFMPGIELDKERIKQLSRHYAILGAEIAKKYIKEGKKLFIYDPWDKKERARIDWSDREKGGLPHFEFTHPTKSKGDADKNKSFIEDIINNKHDVPSITKSKLDLIINVQQEYAKQINLHLKVQEETLKTLKLIQKNIKNKRNS